MMKMRLVLVALLVALEFASHVDFGMASPSTLPAFLWSPHLQFRGVFCLYGALTLMNFSSADGEMDEAVNYQVISAKTLVDSVFTRGGWSNFLCSEKRLQQSVDVALVFIDRELLSSDVFSNGNLDPALVNTLKNLYSASNFSLAFPYIATPEEERMETLLLSGLNEACAHNLGASNIVFSDSCFVEDGTIQKLSKLRSFKDHLAARKKKQEKKEKQTWLCSALRDLNHRESDQSHSDREIVSQLVNSIEQSGTRYAALYVSDPYWYASYQSLQRFLAETATGNTTAKATTTCDELCQLKSSLLEGIFVGIVFLLILISGLCCMAGIDTPTRFETPQDS